MSPARRADPELDSLIEEITVDCYDEYEQLTAFQTAFENDATFPCPGTVVGEHVEVLSVAGEDDRRELIATCQRNSRHYEIALLDIDLNADPETSRLIAAYHRWIRA
jgi:Calcium binding